jgi:hypothetical protein
VALLGAAAARRVVSIGGTGVLAVVATHGPPAVVPGVMEPRDRPAARAVPGLRMAATAAAGSRGSATVGAGDRTGPAMGGS